MKKICGGLKINEMENKQQKSDLNRGPIPLKEPKKEPNKVPEKNPNVEVASNIAQRVFNMVAQLSSGKFTGEVKIMIETKLDEGKITGCTARIVTDNETKIV